jgi:hypothetical protein
MPESGGTRASKTFRDRTAEGQAWVEAAAEGYLIHPVNHFRLARLKGGS